jgi:transposase
MPHSRTHFHQLSRAGGPRRQIIQSGSTVAPLAYDTTNFYTYIASTNQRNQLAQRGHNKQGRHNLRQVGLSYVLDGENGLSLCHHVYPGNVADVEEFPTALARITRMLDQNQIARNTVTLVLDKGSAARANTVALEEAGLGWIPPCIGTRRRQNCAVERWKSWRCAAAPNLGSGRPRKKS